MSSWVVVGLGFGDEGKGATVDRLCEGHNVSAVVRYNGGCQAAHNVVKDDGRHHTFAQFGSGTLAGVPTFLSRYMMVEPLSLVKEAEHLRELGVDDPFNMLFVDNDCLLTTPYHWIANQHREAERGHARHGSCGRGIGDTASYALLRPGAAPRMRDFRNRTELGAKLTELREFVAAELPGVELPAVREVLSRYAEVPEFWRTATGDLGLFAEDGDLVFEGAQGVLLDEWYGFHPHTTWSTTTTANAETLLNEIGIDDYSKLGITRSYHTRHGAGPFPSESPRVDVVELHNDTGEWQGAWRVGDLDLLLLRYAAQATGGIDGLVVTHMDRSDAVRMVSEYGWQEGDSMQRIPTHWAEQQNLLGQEVLARVLDRVRLCTYSAFDLGALSDAVSASIVMLGDGPQTSQYRSLVDA